MDRVSDIKLKFNYADKPESEELLELVYSRIFQTAYMNLTKNNVNKPIIKSNAR